jgi:YcxB-like protein
MIAHRNATRSFRIALPIVFLIAGLTIIALVMRPTSDTLLNVVPLLGLALLWALCKWASPWWDARSQFRKQPSAQGPRTLLLDGTGIHWRWDGGTADIEWKNVIRYLESNNEFFLYGSPAAFNMVPKRALSAEQLTEFRSLLAEHVESSRK